MIDNKMNNGTEAAEKGFLVPTGQGPYSQSATSKRFCVEFLSKNCHPPSLPHQHDKTWDDLRACPEQIWCQPSSPVDPRVPLSQSQPCLPQRVRNRQSGWNPELGCRGVWVLTQQVTYVFMPKVSIDEETGRGVCVCYHLSGPFWLPPTWNSAGTRSRLCLKVPSLASSLNVNAQERVAS